MTHKHKWTRDTTRLHGRPPRVFVVCDCGASGQAVITHGYTDVFRVNEKKYIGAYFDITPEQKRLLKQTSNQSETVRLALDKFFEQVYTNP